MFRFLLRCLVPLLFLLFFNSACDKPPEQPAILLQVGKRQLTMSQFKRELQQSYPDLTELPEQQQLQLKIQLVNRLIEREMIFAEAERIDLRVSPDELDAAMAELRGSYTAAEYRQVLHEAGQTEQSWKNGLKLRLISQKLSAALVDDKAKINEKDAEKYYLANREEFRRPEELRARQMLFANVEDAEAVLKQLKAGADFATLAREHSLSPDRENGGNLGYFSRGQLPPEFDQALFRLGAGQISDPVKSPYGVHLFLVERRRPAGIRPFAAIKHEIIAKLSQQREEEAFQDRMEKLRAETPVKVAWKLLKITAKDIQ